jgi:hypothetical protein
MKMCNVKYLLLSLLSFARSGFVIFSVISVILIFFIKTEV